MIATAGDIHKFELAGLGKSPFRVVGHHVSKFQTCADAPVQPGSSCDYCGAAIMYVFSIRSSDGKTFKVGCDCVEKTDDSGIINPVKREMARIKREAVHASQDAAIADAAAYLELVRDQLADMPFPTEYRPTNTRADWVDWMMKNAGRSGKMQVVKFLKGVK